MTRPARHVRLALAVAALAASAGAAAAQYQPEIFDDSWKRVTGDPAKGEQLAIEICARCHVIGDFNPMGGINSTPSFWIMRRKPETYAPKLLTIQERRPHAGMKLDVKRRELEHILVYVQSLEPK